jgi:hypothetical protein
MFIVEFWKPLKTYLLEKYNGISKNKIQEIILSIKHENRLDLPFPNQNEVVDDEPMEKAPSSKPVLSIPTSPVSTPISIPATPIKSPVSRTENKKTAKADRKKAESLGIETRDESGWYIPINKIRAMIEQFELQDSKSSLFSEKVGDGIKSNRNKRRVVFGKGYKSFEPNPNQNQTHKNFIVVGKYVIDLNELARNSLTVKYSKNYCKMIGFNGLSISTELRETIEDTLKGSFNRKIFLQMKEPDRRVFDSLNKRIKLGLNTQDDSVDNWKNKFEILKGELQSGNDSPEIVRELKQYLLEGFRTRRLSKTQMIEEMLVLS